MKRPLLLRALPASARQKVFYKFYNQRQHSYTHLFEKADLEFANGVALYDLLPGDVISGNIAFNGFYELSLSRRIRELAKTGGLFVDVGANIGYFSMIWTSAHEQSRAICFEASPRNVKILTSNVERNSLSDRVTIKPKAVGRELGTINFDVGPSTQTGWGGISNDDSVNSISVPMTRLDNELSNELIEVLKIDVEGADTWVLEGCERLLRDKRIKRIFFEQNIGRMEQLGIQAGVAQTFLRDLGYSCEPLDGDEGEWVASPIA